MRRKIGAKLRHALLLAGIGAGVQAIFAAHCVVVKQQLTRVHSRNWKRISARLERRLCFFFSFFFLPRSTAVNPAPPTQPRSSHSQASLLLDTVRQAGSQAGGRAGGLACWGGSHLPYSAPALIALTSCCCC